MADQSSESLDLDANVQHTAATQEKEAEEKPRQGDQCRPYCRVHMCLMVASNTSKGVTRYSCPVPACKEGEKRSQPASNIPRQPLACPVCTRPADGKKKASAVYCVVDYPRSSFAMLQLTCPTPGCHFHVKVPRPDVAARSNVMRRREGTV